VHLHGIVGVGKSTRENFSTQASMRGASVIRLDYRHIEPTPLGFASEVGKVTGSSVSSPEEATERLGSVGHKVVVAIDSYELFRLLDTWLRQVFVPGLSDTVRIVFSSRLPPSPPWLIALVWQGLFRSLPLGPLNEEEALEVLSQAGVEGTQAERINHLARGHPLALRLVDNLTE
jgi:hypothetical protein